MFFELIKYGFFNGVLIALISLGFSLIYNVLRIIDFSLTDRMTICAYLFSIFLPVFGIPISIILAIIMCILLSILTEKIIYSRLLNKGTTLIMMTSFGLSIVIQSILAIIFGSTLLVTTIEEIPIKNLRLYPREVISLLVLIISLLILIRWLKNSKYGKALRAISSNLERAVFINLPVSFLNSLAFGISGFFVGIAGMAIAIGTGTEPNTGFRFMIYSFTSCIVGGLKNPIGAVIVALLLGILLSFTEAYISALAGEAISLCILVFILLWMPNGIFGEKLRTI